MKATVVLLIALVVLAVTPISMADYVYFYIEDGLSYTFNDNTHQLDTVGLDYNTANTPGTHVDMVDGGLVSYLAAFNIATITMYGGTVEHYLMASDNSTVTMSGGLTGGLLGFEDATITMSGGSVSFVNSQNNAAFTMTGGSVRGNLFGEDNSTVTMSGGLVEESLRVNFSNRTTISGGTIGYSLGAGGSSTVTMSGGTIGYSLGAGGSSTVTMSGGTVANFLYARDDASIYLDGTGFQITDLDGKTTNLSDGDILSDFGTSVEYISYPPPHDHPISLYYYTGTITGMLADGSALNNSFEIYNTGDIIIGTVPEPATLLLFGLGSIVILRRNKY